MTQNADVYNSLYRGEKAVCEDEADLQDGSEENVEEEPEEVGEESEHVSTTTTTAAPRSRPKASGQAPAPQNPKQSAGSEKTTK
ncbi:hypothetical protein M513_12156 [Trichuris suis]|uniref:Uncharacterized protein n=1 Tax=Trichuris suis TaxID=68888 RepID=A0A085LPS0_9BILA|nr:hypothetical protein M513_13745 [Trichuris suis]KFD46966.1 hypothetical protein M513_12156 [Trichuris suis]